MLRVANRTPKPRKYYHIRRNREGKEFWNGTIEINNHGGYNLLYFSIEVLGLFWFVVHVKWTCYWQNMDYMCARPYAKPKLTWSFEPGLSLLSGSGFTNYFKRLGGVIKCRIRKLLKKC